MVGGFQKLENELDGQQELGVAVENATTALLAGRVYSTS